jgi:hypothetical protein
LFLRSAQAKAPARLDGKGWGQREGQEFALRRLTRPNTPKANWRSPKDVPDCYRDHPFACMQRVSNSDRFTSAVAPSILVEAMVFEASN